MKQRKIEEDNSNACGVQENASGVRRNNNNRNTQVYYPNANRSILHYIVANAEVNKTDRVKLLNYLHSQGHNAPNVRNCSKVLAQAVSKRGKDGLYDLAKIHPDREVIINQYLVEKGLLKDTAKKDDFDNSCGCYGATDEQDNSNTSNNTNSDNKLSLANGIIITGVSIVVLSFAFLLTKTK